MAHEIEIISLDKTFLQKDFQLTKTVYSFL